MPKMFQGSSYSCVMVLGLHEEGRESSTCLSKCTYPHEERWRMLDENIINSRWGCTLPYGHACLQWGVSQAQLLLINS